MFKQKRLFNLFLLVMTALFVCIGCVTVYGSSKKIGVVTITSPSDENGPVTPGHGFFINGTFDESIKVPEDAILRVSVYDKSGKEIRYAQMDKKCWDEIDRFNEAFFFYDDEDPMRTGLTASAMPFLIVEDEDNPEASIKDATIKCYYDDSSFSAFIPYATDEEHGLIFDDGVGYLDGNGKVYDGMPEGDYLIKVRLTNKQNEAIAYGAKSFKIEQPKEAILARFHPDEHYNNVMEFSKENNLSMNVDWLPGYYKDSQGNDKGGMRAMFLGADCALYKDSHTHMLIWNTSRHSSSASFELVYISKYSDLDDPEKFSVYCYSLGEPCVRVGDQLIDSKIVPFEKNEIIHLCRADYAANAKNGIVNMTDEKIYEMDSDFTDGISFSGNQEDGCVAFAGVVAPGNQKPEEIIFHPETNECAITNHAGSIYYEISDGTNVKQLIKPVVLTRTLDGETLETAEYEFYHVFPKSDIDPTKEYQISMTAYDMDMKMVEGSKKSFRYTPAPEKVEAELSFKFPSSDNLPMPTGRDFYVNGKINITNGKEIPANAKMEVALLDSKGKTVRKTTSIAKGADNLWPFHEEYSYPDDETDPERKECLTSLDPMLVVKDMKNPMKSFNDATIKCTFDDKTFRALIVGATDQAHGLCVDNHIGYTNADGSPISALEEGRYTITAKLTDADGTVIGSAEKEIEIKIPEKSVIARFDYDPNYDTWLPWAKEENMMINMDWIPGYLPNDKGTMAGFRHMFFNNDVAAYDKSQSCMLMYLVEKASVSNKVELGYLQYKGMVGDPEKFQAYHYDIGEPVLYLPNCGKDEVQGKIVPFDKGDYLDICRVDTVKESTDDNYFQFDGGDILGTQTDMSKTIEITAGDDFAISGVIAPFQIDKKDVQINDDATYIPNNRVEKLEYTFDDGKTQKKAYKNAYIVRSAYDQKSEGYFCWYEFYNVFSSDDMLKKNAVYDVSIQGYDIHNQPVEGACDSFKIRIKP